jgi:hypothetical protein
MEGKKKSLVVLLLVAGLVLATGVVAFAHRWDFDAAEEVKKLNGTLEYSQSRGYTLSTPSGEQYRLLLHPMRFLDETKMEIRANDRVSVSGYKVEDDVIWVSTITKGSKTYTIADPDEIGRFRSDSSGYGPSAGTQYGGMRGVGRNPGSGFNYGQSSGAMMGYGHGQSGRGWNWNDSDDHCW